MVVQSSSTLNMEKLKDANIEMDTCVNIYVRKWRLLLVLNIANWTIKEKKRDES